MVSKKLTPPQRPNYLEYLEVLAWERIVLPLIMSLYPPKKIVDLHHHAATLNGLIRLRGKLQGHLVTLDEHLRHDRQVILSVSLYVNFYRDYDRILQMIQTIKEEINRLGERATLITHQGDLNKNFNLGIVLHVESARTLTKFDDQLPRLFEQGVRGIIPMHFVDNHLGTSCDDPLRRVNLKREDLGLSKEGVKFTELCNQLGLWIDLTHTTDKTGHDFLSLAHKVMVSHTGIRDLKNIKRNKSLSFLKDVSRKDGVIGLSPWGHLFSGQAKDYLHMVSYAHEHGLDQHICIGSDFGAPIKTEPSIKSIFDIGEIYPNENFLHSNALRFLSHSLPS